MSMAPCVYLSRLQACAAESRMWRLDAGRSGVQKREGGTNNWVSSWVARMDPSVLSICDLEPLYLLLILSFE